MSAWLKLDPKDIFAFAVSTLIGIVLGRLVPDPDWGIYVSILVTYHLFLGWLVMTGEHEAGLSMPIGQTIFTHVGCVVLIVAIGLGRRHVPFFAIFRYGIAAMAIFERGWLFSVSRHAPKYEGPIDLLKPRNPAGLVHATSSLAVPQAGPAAYKPIVPELFAPAKPAPTVRRAPAAPAGNPAVHSVANATPSDSPAAAAKPAQKRAQMVPMMVRDNTIANVIRRKPTAEEIKDAPILSATAQDHEDWLREKANANPTHRRPGMSVREEYEIWLKARQKARASRSGIGASTASR